MLARSPEMIRISEAVAILEGPVAPMDCANPEVSFDCELERDCGLRQVWADVKAAADQILASWTLTNLVPRRFERQLEQTT